jgi:Protein of unknown function (DUF1524)
MMSRRRRIVGRHLVRVLLAGAAAALLVGCGVTSAAPPAAAPVGLDGSYRQLERLTVATPRPMTGYSRARFPHWADRGGGCTARELVLRRDGQDVTVGADCAPTGGRWKSPYDRAVLTDPGMVDVDHVVPLANAWRSGADQWTTPRRAAFANDLDHPELLAVSRASNRAKGDQAPDQWRPPNTGYWCTYASAWITVKDAWKLTVTATEQRALKTMLRTCQTGTSR